MMTWTGLDKDDIDVFVGYINKGKPMEDKLVNMFQ